MTAAGVAPAVRPSAQPATPADAIRADGVSLTFAAGDETVHALSDIHLSVPQGSFTSLIGPSGCGKTTLLRAIADLEQPTAGRLLVAGMTPREARLSRAYGYAFQAPALFPWRSAKRNVRLPLELSGMTKVQQRERAARYLDLVGLSDFKRRFPWQLSGGMQQRVSIARAFASHLPTLGADFVQTVLRVVLPGYVAGCAAGLLAAIALDRSAFLRRGKAAVVVVMTFFPTLVQATASLGAAGAAERDLMRVYGAGYLATLLRLRLPAAVPFLFVALKLNATLALIGAIVAEFFGTSIVGMGFRISMEATRMNLGLVWAEIVLASLAGTLAFAALSLLERRAAFWHPSFR